MSGHVVNALQRFDGALDGRHAAFLENQLEYVKSQTYNIQYCSLKSRLLITGHNDSKLTGSLTNANVTIKEATSPWFGAAVKDPRKNLDDLARVVSDILDRTEELHAPDTLLLPTKHFAYIPQTPVSTNTEIT